MTIMGQRTRMEEFSKVPTWSSLFALLRIVWNFHMKTVFISMRNNCKKFLYSYIFYTFPIKMEIFHLLQMIWDFIRKVYLLKNNEKIFQCISYISLRVTIEVFLLYKISCSYESNVQIILPESVVLAIFSYCCQVIFVIFYKASKKKKKREKNSNQNKS